MGYSSAHETSHLHTYTFKEGARGSGGRVTLLRCLRPQALPDPFGQLSPRTCPSGIAENLGCGSQAVRNAIHDFNESVAWAPSEPAPRVQEKSTPPSTRAGPRHSGMSCTRVRGTLAKRVPSGHCRWPPR